MKPPSSSCGGSLRWPTAQFVLDIMGRPAAERAQLLQQYESDLRALLDHYSKRENVPKEAITWANEALESVKELNRIANERAAALEGFGSKFKRIWEMFNEPVNTRENVRKYLGRDAHRGGAGARISPSGPSPPAGHRP